MSEYSVDGMVEQVAKTLGRAISVEDLDGHLISYSSHQDTTDKVRTEFLLSKVVSAQVRAWQDSHGIASAVAAVQIPANRELGMRGRVCLPLLVRGFRVGYLWVQESEVESDGAKIAAQLPRLRTLTDSLAERLLDTATVDSEYRRARENTFVRAVSGDGESARDAFSWVPLDPGESYVVGVFYERPDPRGGSRREGSATDQMLARSNAALQSSVGDDRVLFSAGQANHAILLMRAPLPERDVAHIGGALAAKFSRIGKVHAGDFVLGLSEIGRDPEDVGDKYAEAIVATQAACVDPFLGEKVPLGASRSSESTLKVLSHAHAGIYPLLARQLAGRVRSRSIESLRKYPQGDLMDVLEHLYERDGSISQTAHELHQHRSSIYNKLERIAGLLGFDPMRGQGRLELHLALKLDRWSGRPRI